MKFYKKTDNYFTILLSENITVSHFRQYYSITSVHYKFFIERYR
jgi:hypothetical protein